MVKIQRFIFVMCLFASTASAKCRYFAQDYHNKKIDSKSMASLPTQIHGIFLDSHSGPVTIVKWAPDNMHIATACPTDNFVRIWKADTGMLIALVGTPYIIMDIDWSQDGTKIAIAAGTEVRIADLTSTFQAEKDLTILTPEQMNLVNIVVSSQDLTKLNSSQQKIFETIPSSIKYGLEEKLKMNQFDKDKNQVNEKIKELRQ